MNVYIIHQYGEPEHFRSLTALKRQKKDLHLFFADFHYKQDLCNGLIKADIKMLRKGLTSLLHFARSILDKNGVIIYGLAPGDKRILFIERYYSKRKLIYFTSAAEYNWKSPKLKLTAPDCKKAWNRILKKSHVVHVNRLSAAVLRSCRRCKSITIIPHSIEADIYNTSKRNRTVSDVLNVCYVGKIIPEKGIRELLWCAKQLIGKPIEFHCIGNGDDVLVRDMKRASNIKYYGYMADKKKLSEIMQNMDVLVLPTYKELFGMVIIEAMACGAVPIATDCIGPKCIIEDRKNGVLIPQRDQYALLQEIINLSEDRALLASLQTNALSCVSSYTTERLSQKWASILFS